MMNPYPEDEDYYPINQDLASWLASRRKTSFPFEADYSRQYLNIRDKMSGILKEIDRGALYQSALKIISSDDGKPDDLIYLTNHGPDHVRCVAERATSILTSSGCRLSAYEGYLLLTAILIHDIGNLFGRSDHEVKASEIMGDLGGTAGDDSLEKRTIMTIALVHGGSISESRDTISLLPEADDLLGKPVRVRLLASILRFADELADDSSRAARYLINIDKLPKESIIYHRYSDVLKSVRIVDNEVLLRYDLDEDSANTVFTKSNMHVLLIDEIYSRAVKMHRERMYCMRYMRPLVDIKSIRVDITIYQKIDEIEGEENRKSALLQPERIQYTLEETGYPDCPDDVLMSNCSGEPSPISGSDLQAMLQEKRKSRNGNS